jgi:hypothetical protein
MAFRDQVKTAVQQAKDVPNSAPALAYVKVLKELAEALGELDVGAEVLQNTADARRLAINLFPKFRPGRASPMLTFFLDEAEIVVFGIPERRMKTPEELERLLLEFVKLPEFVESLTLLQQEAARPVEARLRASRTAITLVDLAVLVAPEVQAMLYAAPSTSAVAPFTITRINYPGNPLLTIAQAYALLESAGVTVVVDRIDRADPQAADQVTVHGHRA